MPEPETQFDKCYSECAALLRRTGSADETFGAAMAIIDDDYRNNTLARLALLLVDSGQVGQALRFCSAISRSLDRALAFADLGRALLKRGASVDARDALSRAEEASREIEQPDDASLAYLQICESLARAGQGDHALTLLRRAAQLAQSSPQHFEAAKTLRGCARLLASWNRVAEAITLAKTISDQWSELRETSLREIQANGASDADRDAGRE